MSLPLVYFRKMSPWYLSRLGCRFSPNPTGIPEQQPIRHQQLYIKLFIGSPTHQKYTEYLLCVRPAAVNHADYNTE